MSSRGTRKTAHGPTLPSTTPTQRRTPTGRHSECMLCQSSSSKGYCQNRHPRHQKGITCSRMCGFLNCDSTPENHARIVSREYQKPPKPGGQGVPGGGQMRASNCPEKHCWLPHVTDPLEKQAPPARLRT